MKDLTQPVPAKVLDNGYPVSVGIICDRAAYIIQRNARPDHPDTGHHRVVGDIHQPGGLAAHLTHAVHTGCVAVPTIQHHCHVNVRNIAILQPPLARNPMADDMVDRDATGMPITAIADRCRDSTMIEHEGIDPVVEILGEHARHDMFGNHVETGRSQPTRLAHTFKITRRMQANVASISFGILHVVDRAGLRCHGALLSDFGVARFGCPACHKVPVMSQGGVANMMYGGGDVVVTRIEPGWRSGTITDQLADRVV